MNETTGESNEVKRWLTITQRHPASIGQKDYAVKEGIWTTETAYVLNDDIVVEIHTAQTHTIESTKTIWPKQGMAEEK